MASVCVSIASYPAFTYSRKNAWFQPFAHARKFSQKSGKLCYFGILPRNGHLQWQWWRWVFINHGLTSTQTKYTVTGSHGKMTVWWLFYFLLHGATIHVLENVRHNHTNGAMKLVNFTHAQMAETRHSFRCLWTPGTRLVWLLLLHVHTSVCILKMSQWYWLTVVTGSHVVGVCCSCGSLWYSTTLSSPHHQTHVYHQCCHGDGDSYQYQEYCHVHTM